MTRNSRTVSDEEAGPLFGRGTTLVLLCTVSILLSTGNSQAQSPPEPARSRGTLTIGLQAGDPGGITAKLYRADAEAVDAVFTTDGDDFATLHIHHLWETPLSDSTVYIFGGSGLLVEGRELQSNATPQAGLSGEVGLNLFIERFEVFLHLTPTFRFVPDQRAGVGGSVGLRFRLW